MVLKYFEDLPGKRGRKPIKYALMNDKYIATCKEEHLKVSKRFVYIDKPLFYPKNYVITESGITNLAKQFEFKRDEFVQLLEDSKWIKSTLKKETLKTV